MNKYVADLESCGCMKEISRGREVRHVSKWHDVSRMLGYDSVEIVSLNPLGSVTSKARLPQGVS
jgi:hypothetical protein